MNRGVVNRGAVISTLAGLALLAAPLTAAASTETDWTFCGASGSDWSTSTKGRSGVVTITGECTLNKVNWRVDVYVNGEWWAYSTGKVGATGHTLKTVVPTMPKPNDKRGNYTWAKITYTYGATMKNVNEEDLGYLPCTGCTG